MAYADVNQTNRKFGAGATVLALEVAIAWAIIGALGMTITRPPKTVLQTYPTTPESPKPHDPVPQPSTHPLDPAPRPTLIPPLDLGPIALTTFVPPDTITDVGYGGGIASSLPTPAPSPAHSFTPKAARPQGNMAQWVTTNDYPTSGLRGEHEGSTRY